MSVSYLIQVQSPGGGFVALPVVKVSFQLSVSIFHLHPQLPLMPSAGNVVVVVVRDCHDLIIIIIIIIIMIRQFIRHRIMSIHTYIVL